MLAREIQIVKLTLALKIIHRGCGNNRACQLNAFYYFEFRYIATPSRFLFRENEERLYDELLTFNTDDCKCLVVIN
jgi:hypothetical protein